MTSHLCASCRHCKLVRTKTSVFYLCGRHQQEPGRFARYPRVPVLTCAGHERATYRNP